MTAAKSLNGLTIYPDAALDNSYHLKKGLTPLVKFSNLQ